LEYCTHLSSFRLELARKEEARYFIVGICINVLNQTVLHRLYFALLAMLGYSGQEWNGARLGRIFVDNYIPPPLCVYHAPVCIG
jgi:hypothetical protein